VFEFNKNNFSGLEEQFPGLEEHPNPLEEKTTAT
jgi:hypothetical protein